MKPRVAAPSVRAVREGKGGDRCEQLAERGDEQQQAEHEKQMVRPGQNMLDAQPQIGCENIETVRHGSDHKGRRGGREEHVLHRPVERFDPHQNIGHRRVQPSDGDGLAAKSAFTSDAAALDERIARLHGRRRRVQVTEGGKLRGDAKPERPQRRHFPEHVKHSGVELSKLQIARANLVPRSFADR